MAKVDQSESQKTHFIFSFFSLFALFAILSDIYRNPNTFEKFFFIHPTEVLFLFLVISVLLKSIFNYRFPNWVKRINDWIVFPLSSAVSLLFTLIEYFSYEDYIFRNFAINYEYISYLALVSLAFLLITKNHTWWKKYWRLISFSFFPFLFLVLLTIRLWSFENFSNLIRDDQLIEWSQFFVILTTSITALLTARLLRHKFKKTTILYFILTILFFLIAGEEISWGQRIVGFGTPNLLAQSNLQDETTIHNLFFLRQPTLFAYLLITTYGSFAALIFSKIKIFKKRYHPLLVPPWFAIPYFLIPLIYYIHTLPGFSIYYTEWSEVCELFLYLGIFFFMLNGYINTRYKR